MVGLEGSLKIIEAWNGWAGRVLKDHRAVERVGLEGSLKIVETQYGWVGEVLKDHRATE